MIPVDSLPRKLQRINSKIIIGIHQGDPLLKCFCKHQQNSENIMEKIVFIIETRSYIEIGLTEVCGNFFEANFKVLPKKKE